MPINIGRNKNAFVTRSAIAFCRLPSRNAVHDTVSGNSWVTPYNFGPTLR